MLQKVNLNEIRAILGTQGKVNDCIKAEAALINGEVAALRILNSACFNGRWEKADYPGYIQLKCTTGNNTITLNQNGDPIKREYNPSVCVYSCSVIPQEPVVLLGLEDSIIAQSRFLFVLKKHFGIEHIGDSDKTIF